MIARVILLCLMPALASAQAVNVGSKRFTESYILGEILTQKMRETGEASITHRQGLGNTAIVFAALRSGAIDLYAEYTGTLAFELLNRAQAAGMDELRRDLASTASALRFHSGSATPTRSRCRKSARQRSG